MTLLEELLTERDYWLTPSSKSGFSNHPSFKIIKVKKGANTPELEWYLGWLESQMIEALQDADGG